MAGANAVGIGSAIYYKGITVFDRICDEMKQWMYDNGYTKLEKIIGAAHE